MYRMSVERAGNNLIAQPPICHIDGVEGNVSILLTQNHCLVLNPVQGSGLVYFCNSLFSFGCMHLLCSSLSHNIIYTLHVHVYTIMYMYKYTIIHVYIYIYLSK